MAYSAKWIFALYVLVVFAVSGYAKADVFFHTSHTNAAFKYKLHTSDIHCWIDGECQGKLDPAAKKYIATELEKTLYNTHKSLDLAIFGLRNQDWFVDAIKSLVEEQSAEVRVTLDQQKGLVGDWLTKKNFIYPDAFKLFRILGNGGLKVDVNLDGSVRTGTLMHHKFFVQDKKRTWFGSTNISDSETGNEYNANASIMIESPELAAVFTQEFDQMFTSRRYGIHKKDLRGVERVVFADRTVADVYFSPQHAPIINAVIPFIRSAKRSLDIAMFYLTDDKVAEAIIEAQKRGVKIRLISDATAAANLYSAIPKLRNEDIDARVENWGGKMHMKSAIRDGKDTIIGSINWTHAGNADNDEHLVLIQNNPALAKQLTSYFDSLWATLRPLGNRRAPRAEGRESINSCSDGSDNDHDNLVDEDDPDCQ